jgi:hypothetical protein
MTNDNEGDSTPSNPTTSSPPALQPPNAPTLQRSNPRRASGVTEVCRDTSMTFCSTISASRANSTRLGCRRRKTGAKSRLLAGAWQTDTTPRQGYETNRAGRHAGRHYIVTIRCRLVLSQDTVAGWHGCFAVEGSTFSGMTDSPRPNTSSGDCQQR